MTWRERFNLEAQAIVRAKVVVAAQAFLDGHAGVIETARRLSSLAGDLVDDPIADPDLVFIIATDSESDGLPIGEVRKLWAEHALAERDLVIQRFETRDRPEMEAVCRNLIARFRTSNER